MVGILLAARLILSLVFLFAGVAKLRDRAGFSKTLPDFGIPAALAGPLSVMLPVIEIAVSLALPGPSWLAWPGAWAALGLLLLFMVAIAGALARGLRPDCHCFGQLSSKPVGWGSLGRNAVLAAIPAWLLSQGPSHTGFAEALGTFNWREGLIALAAGACVGFLVFQTWLTFQLVQQGGRILLRLDAIERAVASGASEAPSPAGQPAGTIAPGFSLPDLDGNLTSLQQLRGEGKPVLLLFTSPACQACSGLLPDAARWQSEYARFFTLVLISQGTAAENRSKADAHKLRNVLLQRESETANDYKSVGTPSAVMIRSDGAVGSALANGAEAIRGLVSETVNESVAGPELRLRRGDSVPPMVYPDIDGNMVSLTRFQGRITILLFWSPACGFCQQMTDSVKVWERANRGGRRDLVLISSGTAEENRKQGFRSLVVLNQSFSAGKTFGAGGTPAAVVLDSAGLVASEIAMGREEIFSSILDGAAG